MNRSISIILIIILALSTVWFATSCSSNQSGSAASSTTAVEDASADAPAGESGTAPADLSGEIMEIIGNEVILKLVEPSDAALSSEQRVPGSGRGKSGETQVRNYTGEILNVIIPVGVPIVKRVRQANESTNSSSGTGSGPVEEPCNLDDLTKGTLLKIDYLPDGKTIEKVLAILPRG